MSVVSFRAAWRWILIWFALDVLLLIFQSDLPSWLPTARPWRDFDIMLFICGLWIFERSTPEHSDEE